MIFLLQYSDSDDFLFIPITKVYQKDGKVAISILVSIEEEESSNNYCIGFVYEESNSSKGQFTILDEIVSIDNKSEMLKPNSKCESPIFTKYHVRRYYKVNLANIPYFGKGKYGIVLLKGGKKELENYATNNLTELYKKQLSNVCFEVVEESSRDDKL